MKFSLTPGAETGFSQWLDAMKMVAQLPGGMPSEFRTKLWLQLSEKHLSDQNVDWEKAEAVIFNEWTNPDDEELGVQIVKDLHRTGCSLFCGEQEHNQALLKRVLLAYARWNKNVGYCQGFNMLAALILQVMDKDEKNAVKVMIYLIEGVLPESYFANNLRGLSVDMAVFRDLLRLRLPKLSKHLEALQHDTNAGTSYEPPLTNVFTMQWFLTLFSNCLPQQTVLRVWDLVFLYGNEVLLRTAIAIWGILQDRVITVESADEFYSIMGVVTREMLEFGLMDANALVKTIAMVDPFPNELQELREKYLYNISPWTQSVHSAAKKGIRLFYSDPDDQDDTEDEDKIALATAYGVFRRRESTSKELQVSGPTLDISVLKQQYAKLRQRQRQAHVIITAACSSNLTGSLTAGPSVSVNHLLMGKSALINKGRRIGPPEGSIPPPNNKKEEKEERKPKVVISGETFHWKDAEKRKLSKASRKSKSNKEVMHENERNRVKAEGEEDRLKTNHDRMGGVSEESVENSLRRKANSSGSSDSSTSTELCDEEFHRYTDSDDATPSDLGASPKSPRRVDFPQNPKLLGNGGCDKNNLKEIKTVAINLVNEIEEKIQTSGKLTRMRQEETQAGDRSPSPCKITPTQFDNTKNLILDSHLQVKRDNILKPEPEVPTFENVIQNPEASAAEMKSPREEGGGWGELEGGKNRRKSDLALSVIKENLEMLKKYSQKTGETSEPEKKPEVNKMEDMMWFDDCKKDVGTGGTGELFLRFPHEKEIQKTVPQVRASKNFLVEKAISPIVEKSIKTVKVNKEVNTELTFGVDEVEISTRQSKLESKYKFDTISPAEEAACRNPRIPREKDSPTRRKPQEHFQEYQPTASQISQEHFQENQLATSRKPQEHFQENELSTSGIPQKHFQEYQPTSQIPQELFQENQPATSRKPQEHFQEYQPPTSRKPQEHFQEYQPATSRIPLEPFREKDSPTCHKSRELFREKDEIKKRIETSKSDWELKMRKIAELETTTRETLNEIQARSNNRKSLHRSLDRNTRRTYLDEYKLKSPDKPFIPKIHLESSNPGDGEPNHRKLKISAKSFDEITSRTEKLLGKAEFNRSTDETSYKRTLSPEFEPWKQKDSTSKYKNLLEENFQLETNPRKSYGFSSSPTSPEYRTQSNIRYPDYLTPRYSGEGKGKYEDDLMRITQNESKTSLELLERKYSPENRKPEIEFESHSSRGSFNPFPKRTVSRPKELGVKLGLYPTSPDAQSKNS